MQHVDLDEQKKYVLKLDGNYYAGPNEKYSDMFNISGSGPLGAKFLTQEEAEKLKDFYTKHHFDTEIEEYNPKLYLEQSLNKILKYEQECQKGKSCGYAILNLAEHCLEYLEQI